MSPTPKPRRSKRTSIILTLLALGITISALIVFSRSRSHLKVEIVLVSPPQLMPGTTEFYVYQPATAGHPSVTQNFYRAEVQIKNPIAPGPYRGAIWIEILEGDSTDWISANQPTFSMLYPIIKPGDSMTTRLCIPASATKWRATCGYERWFLPERVLNNVLRNWLHLPIQIGDSKIHEAQSETWILEKPTPPEP